MISSGEHAASMVISFITLGLTKMLILMVGEVFSIFPSSKASGVGIGFFNQSTCPGGLNSLVSIAHTWVSMLV